MDGDIDEAIRASIISHCINFIQNSFVKHQSNRLDDFDFFALTFICF